MGKKINRLKKELAEMESEIKSCMRGRDYCKKKSYKYNHRISHTLTGKKTEAVIWRMSLRRKKHKKKQR